MTDGVALYLRVSTDEQDLAGQRRDLEQYAASRGWRVARVYREKESASGHVARGAYAMLLWEARNDADRGWSRVLVWALDRWSRDPSFVRAIGSIEGLEELGIRWHSFKEPGLDSSDDGAPTLERQVLRALLPVVATFESRRRADRTRVAMREIKEGRRKTRSGKPPGRPARPIPPAVLRRALELRKTGKSWSEAAAAVGFKAERLRRAAWEAKSTRAAVENPPPVEKGPAAGGVG